MLFTRSPRLSKSGSSHSHANRVAGRGARSRRSTYRPHVESLETRALLSTLDLSGGVVRSLVEFATVKQLPPAQEPVAPTVPHSPPVQWQAAVDHVFREFGSPTAVASATRAPEVECQGGWGAPSGATDSFWLELFPAGPVGGGQGTPGRPVSHQAKDGTSTDGEAWAAALLSVGVCQAGWVEGTEPENGKLCVKNGRR